MQNKGEFWRRWEKLTDQARSVNDEEDVIDLAEAILATARLIAGVACLECGATGRLVYPDTSTWKRGGPCGQAATEDVCGTCWGTGRSDETGLNMKELLRLLETIPIMNCFKNERTRRSLCSILEKLYAG